MRRSLLIAFVLFALTGCALFQKHDHFEAREVDFSDLAGWQEEDHAAALAAFTKSCAILAHKPRPATTGSYIAINADIWDDLCTKAALSQLPKQFFEDNFVPFRIANNDEEKGLFTGYYEPVLYGNLTKQGSYKYPVYGVPGDLHKPYYTRAEIDAGALEKRGLEIAWVDDPVMLFFMQIQGSGRIRLPDGNEFIAGYAEQNGNGYVAIGKFMGDEEMIPKDQINFFTIRQWLYDHPEQAFDVMEHNPSYVFFKKLDGNEVIGAVGAPLTPRRSLAVDARYIPYGLPLFMEAQLPSINNLPPDVFNHMVIAQDTGGAIRSPVRGDIFFGEGQEAEYLAGYMKNRGRYALLVPKYVAPQLR